MNRLSQESSPYLLQHANNPVDWYPWSEEAFEKAKAENKPVLVSIGYAACHWCHVMERESFENHDTAAIMNDRFVNIKIDREERPDLDHIYMDAVQAMTGGGGWPLNVFLTPDKKPFYGGTYFPPTQAFNRPSWTDVLTSLSNSYREKPEEILAQADYLVQHMNSTNAFGLGKPGLADKIGPGLKDEVHTLFDNIMKTADRTDGGFGAAPKFPQTFTIRFLLHYYYHTKEQAALDQALLSLDKMIAGGINDQLGGGFARYSTDSSWLAPHFEKMLYDNALLLIVIAEAYQITGHPKYANTIAETVRFVDEEMTSPENGFYSALDADSEGVEGKFYTWSKAEIESILGEDADLFNAFYDVSERGNWEHTNILNIPVAIETFAAARHMRPEDLGLLLAHSRTKLLQQRSSRIRPQLDDKILIGWNALMCIGLCKAAAATGDQTYRNRAEANIIFLLNNFR
ncbi:MAG: thioredoxin domain-containing protein, partial [Flavitalea sp.]